MHTDIPLNAFDLSVFIAYMIGIVALGFWVAGRERKTTRGYFLGDKKLQR
jgi:Na+/proline symporter